MFTQAPSEQAASSFQHQLLTAPVHVSHIPGHTLRASYNSCYGSCEPLRHFYSVKKLSEALKPGSLRNGVLASQVARRHADEYCQGMLGYKTGNMRFVEGHIELLDRAGIQDESVDIVISNCVINLSPDKPRVLQQVHSSCNLGST